MAEQVESICIPFTHTYDQFTTFFYDGRVYLSDTSYPIGQCCVDIVNMDEEVLSEIDRCVEEFIPAARKLLMEKTNSAVAFAQEKLNAVWDIIFTMPVYRDLNMNLELSYHSLERLYEQKDKWAQVQDVHSEGHEIYERMIDDLVHFANRVRALRLQLRIMTEKYFESLKRRNSATYGTAYSTFYADMLRTGALLFGEDFDQKFSVEIDFVPMMRKENEREFFVAEKTTFNYLHDFLRTEFYRGLAIGNAPRRFHNCGKHFLLTAGYNTCYCGNIAPGETERTCRKVGAHRKEAQGKANRSPARVEYDRTYNRLKQRKVRGKISADEWNAAVAQAMQVLEQAERGELTDDEMRERFRKF